MTPIVAQIVYALVGAVISGVSVHLYHTRGGASPAAPATPAGTPAPAAPALPQPSEQALWFPHHPLASRALQEILADAEAAAIAAAKSVIVGQGAPVIINNPAPPAPAK